MTTPTPHGQVPEALRLAHIFDNPLPPEWPDMVAAAAELRRQHARIAELEAQIEALSGVQALSAAPAVPAGWKAVPVNPTPEMWKAAKTVPDPNPPYPPHYGLVWDAMLAASPTPPAEQAAPKAAPGVVNSVFDHQTAADFLSGKTVSDEAVRKFVATSRWAHDERAALSATLLAMHGVLTSREAEIALLKKALMEAEAAPQQEPAFWTRQRFGEEREFCEAPFTADWTPLYTAPKQEAQDATVAAFEAVRKKLCTLPRYSFVLDDDGLVRRAPDRTGNWIEFDEAHALFDPVSVDAAIAAQGGK